MRLETAIRGGECVLAGEIVAPISGLSGAESPKSDRNSMARRATRSTPAGCMCCRGLLTFTCISMSRGGRSGKARRPARRPWRPAVALVSATCRSTRRRRRSTVRHSMSNGQRLESSSLVDFGLWGGLGHGNHRALEELAERGVIGFKAFMCSSGIDDFPHVNDDELCRGMEIAAPLGLPVAVHAEDDSLVRRLTDEAIAAGKTGVRDFLSSRPVQAELSAIERAITLAEQTGCSLHVVHVSSGAGVRAVVEGRARGIDVTCETCPHYLLLTDEDVERIGAAAKCSPPIRDAAEREALWAALEFGKIDLIASDHSPAPWSMKEWPDFFKVWGGIAGCQTTLGLLLAEGHNRRGIAIQQLVSAVSSAPAERFRLPRKGRIEVGADADLAIVDLSKTKPLAINDLQYRHRISPFIGRPLVGEVRRTMVRGRTVFLDGRIVAGDARGRFVRPFQPAASGWGR